MATNSRQRAQLRVIVVTAVLLVLILFNHQQQQDGRIAVALAKGGQMLALGSMPQLTVPPQAVADLIPADAQFVEAVRLGASEAQAWDCPAYTCALITAYDLEQGVTLSQVVNPDTGEQLAAWEDPLARPPGTIHILPQAVAIAAADAEVTAVLGDIGAADPVMVPMSGWLADDACRQDWCVDLTFHSPSGDGRVFHVFVNLEKETVARTFYTRGRPDLDVEMPVSQRGAFDNGCHDQNGWHLCWEMTAHDGLNFTEATFNGTPVFTSAKIGQIEAWYPSWPGGYRDEIGFNATVRPYDGTEINEIEGGFEIRQLFTEFTRWPNCICCYRYEQIVRVMDDGSYEFRFTSHGPGCDELSIYRPFWRIELPGSSRVWSWQQTEWGELATETELHPFVDDLSPDGFKLATESEGQIYQWRMPPTDPLGLDEAWIFLLQQQPEEGDGPIQTGPGDTYQPPRQWLADDPLSGEPVVVWYVPLLKTKKSNPLWCMPDPEPGINQCEAILQAVPVDELHQPTAEELAQMPTPTATSPPPPTTTPAPTPSPRPIDGETAEEIILNSGCGACHAIGPLGEGGKVGPDLSNIGALAGNRVDGLSAEAYLRQAILEPNLTLVPDCPNGPCLANIMPQDYASRLTPTQIDTLIAYLLTLTEPEPEPLRIIGDNTATAVPKSAPLAKSAQQPGGIGAETSLMLQLVLLGVVFILTMIWIRQRPDEEAD